MNDLPHIDYRDSLPQSPPLSPGWTTSGSSFFQAPTSPSNSSSGRRGGTRVRPSATLAIDLAANDVGTLRSVCWSPPPLAMQHLQQPLPSVLVYSGASGSSSLSSSGSTSPLLAPVSNVVDIAVTSRGLPLDLAGSWSSSLTISQGGNSLGSSSTSSPAGSRPLSTVLIASSSMQSSETSVGATDEGDQQLSQFAELPEGGGASASAGAAAAKSSSSNPLATINELEVGGVDNGSSSSSSGSGSGEMLRLRHAAADEEQEKSDGGGSNLRSALPAMNRCALAAAAVEAEVSQATPFRALSPSPSALAFPATAGAGAAAPTPLVNSSFLKGPPTWGRAPTSSPPTTTTTVNSTRTPAGPTALSSSATQRTTEPPRARASEHQLLPPSSISPLPKVSAAASAAANSPPSPGGSSSSAAFALAFSLPPPPPAPPPPLSPSTPSDGHHNQHQHDSDGELDFEISLLPSFPRPPLSSSAPTPPSSIISSPRQNSSSLFRSQLTASSSHVSRSSSSHVPFPSASSTSSLASTTAHTLLTVSSLAASSDNVSTPLIVTSLPQHHHRSQHLSAMDRNPVSSSFSSQQRLAQQQPPSSWGRDDLDSIRTSSTGGSIRGGGDSSSSKQRSRPPSGWSDANPPAGTGHGHRGANGTFGEGELNEAFQEFGMRERGLRRQDQHYQQAPAGNRGGTFGAAVRRGGIEEDDDETDYEEYDATHQQRQLRTVDTARFPAPPDHLTATTNSSSSSRNGDRPGRSSSAGTNGTRFDPSALLPPSLPSVPPPHALPPLRAPSTSSMAKRSTGPSIADSASGSGSGRGSAFSASVRASANSTASSFTSIGTNGSGGYYGSGGGVGGGASSSRSPPMGSFSKSPSLSTIQQQQQQQQGGGSGASFRPNSTTFSSRSSTREQASAPHPFAAFASPPQQTLPNPGASSGSHSSGAHSHGGVGNGGVRRHPVAALTVAPLALVVTEEEEDDDAYKCPVCVEKMGAEYRIQGEKPDVIPECGHSIHHDCFVHVYGPLPETTRYGVMRQPQSFGVCGVCRKPMKVAEDGGSSGAGSGKASKLAALTGVQGINAPLPPLLNPNQVRSKGHDGDDDIDSLAGPSGSSTRSGASDHVSRHESASQIVVPTIAILPEFSSVPRRAGPDGKLIVHAVVVIEIPERVVINPAADLSRSVSLAPTIQPHRPTNQEVASSSRFLTQPVTASSGPALPSPDELRRRLLASDNTLSPATLDNLSTLLASDRALVRSSSATMPSTGSGKKDSRDRDFLLYLFKEALLCVHDAGPSASPSHVRSKTSSIFKRKPSSSALKDADPGERVLKLKGLVFLHHMKGVVDGLRGTGTASSSSSAHPPSLCMTILMKNRDTDDFVISFADRTTKDRWWDRIVHLLPVLTKDGIPTATGTSGSGGDSMKKSSSASVLSVPSMASYAPSERSQSSLGQNAIGHLRDKVTGRQQPSPTPMSQYDPATTSPTVSILSGSTMTSASNSSLAHTPIDLLLILSLSSPAASSSATALRTRIIRSSLAFLISTLAPRDRLSVVTYENGPGGKIRKTPFLAVGREGRGRRRMQRMLETIGSDRTDEYLDDVDYDEGGGKGFTVTLHREEKADVVSAINVALDVVMQRKTRNALTGVCLVSDSTDSINRGQMDLVLARAEAATVPIHSIGYGKSHDPSPLWLVSNHTHGSYTFVPDWYDLQNTLAGVIGGLMSIAVTKMKIHVSTAATDFRIRKISGSIDASVAPDGRNVDVELRELRHGERKELIVELELDVGPSDGPAMDNSGDDSSTGSATSVSMFGSSGMSMIEDVPALELDCSFADPACGKTCTRLAQPLLLALTLTPPSSSDASFAPPPEPMLVRRRLELLVSDMITRALLLVSKRNHRQAQRLMSETRTIVQTVMAGIVEQLSAGVGHAVAGSKRERREALQRENLSSLEAILVDIEQLLEGLDDESRAYFERDQRNFGAQQAMILRSQRSWTARTETERMYFTAEQAADLLQRSLAAPRD